MSKKMVVLDPTPDLVGTYFSIPVTPAAGSKQVTFTAIMDATRVADPTNFVRLNVWADFGTGPRFMLRGPEWQGGLTALVPTLTWQFNATAPPLAVLASVENGTRGHNSQTILSLTPSFA